MRHLLTLFATDGESEVLVPIKNKVYFYNEYWKEVMHYTWLPKSLCLALSSCYRNDEKAEENEVLEYFKALTLVFSFTQPSFASLLKQKDALVAIYKNIHTIEDSLEFLDYLFVNKNLLFKDNEAVGQEFHCVPVKWEGKEQLIPINRCRGMAYYHTQELDYLYGQEWFAKDSLYICDECYNKLFDGSERIEFYKRLGFNSFDTIDFFRKHILNCMDKLIDKLNDSSFGFRFQAV